MKPDAGAARPIASAARPAAIAHGPGSVSVDDLMADFAAQLIERGFAVGGVVQRNIGDDDCNRHMLLVDVADGQVFDITQNLGAGSDSCRVDPAGVAAAAGAVRTAMARGVDLVIINKFAGLEAIGQGLADELLSAMAAGLPVLTSVGGRYIDQWRDFTGDMADLLPADPAALWRWWGPQRLYADLLHGVADVAARRVAVGAKWVAVQAEDGAVGLAARPAATRANPAPDDTALDRLAARGLRGLAAALLEDWDPLTSAIAVAALNAHYNAPDRVNAAADAGNGLDLFADCDADGPPVAVGAFPQLTDRRPAALVIDHQPGPGQYPAEAADWLLPRAGSALLTASALTNRSLPRLLTAARGRPTALIGPGTPLSPRLFVYGLTALAGFVVTDPDAALAAVARGGGARDIHRHGRCATLIGP